MTKLFAIAFTCVYLTLTVGVAHTTHYCMGRVKSSSYFTFESQKCFCALFALPSSKSCCDDESTLTKIEDDHAASPAISVSPEFYAICKLELPAPDAKSSLSSPPSAHNEGPPGDTPRPSSRRRARAAAARRAARTTEAAGTEYRSWCA